MTWSPIEVILILFLWLPLVLPLILTPYILTIISVNAVAAGSFAVTQGATERGSVVWFALLTGVFALVLLAGIIFLVVRA